MSAESTAFETSGFFVLRAPLLPIETWSRWGAARDLAGLRAYLRDQVERPEVREAIAVASSTLLEGLSDWVKDPDGDSGNKVERALVRYLSRMATRPTPFGLFAGCGVGRFGDRTRIRIAPMAAHARHTRLDNDVLDRLARRLGAAPEIRRHLVYRPNTSLYERGGKMRWVEPRLSGKGRTYDLVAVDVDPFLRAAVARARDGATPEEIAAALAQADPDVTMEDARAFVDELVDSSILVSDLEPAITGPEPIAGFVRTLERIGAHQEASALRGVQDVLRQMDTQQPLRPQDARRADVHARLRSLEDGTDAGRMLQVDLRLALEVGSLDEGVVPELVEAATLVAQCCPEPEEALLRRFCEQFEQRYERREVPLLEALDEDCGIGFGKLRPEGNDPEPMLAEVNIPVKRGAALGRTWGAFEEMLLHRLEALEPGEREIRLEPSDFSGLPRRDVSLPDCCALDVTFAAPGEDAMTRGEYRAFLRLVDGPSGANWLGRFCHADPELEASVKRSLRQEEALRPDAVFAEIVHLPEGRTGNVLLRPVLRRHEIPYLGRSGADPADQLTPDDLVVTVWDGRVVLKSRQLGREVIPRLSSAHAFPNVTNLGLYRFLGALQNGGRPVRTQWTWGALDAAATFLPRVTLGRVVLSLARWSLKPHHLAPVGASTRQGRWDGMQRLRESLRMPRYVCIADADNLLPVDFDNALSVESAARLLRRRPVANLVEMFPEPDATWIAGPEGTWTHELIIPIVRKPPQRNERPTSSAPWLRPAPPVSTRRLCPPGSEWLYLALYASPRSCDHALLRLAPTIRGLKAAAVVERWFFLRMSDRTGWHLRVRLRGRPDRLLREGLPQIREVVEPMLDEGLVWRMQLDTYHREVEHWGGPRGLELAERFLAHDSEAVLSILERYAAEPAALSEARWQLALRGIDGLWAGLGLELNERKALAAACRDGLAREFQIGKVQEKQLGSSHRARRALVERMLGPAPAWPEGCEALRLRDAALRPLFEELHALERTGELTRPVASMADRFSHLHVNRMLRSMLREQELVAMDILARHYRSALARARKRA